MLQILDKVEACRECKIDEKRVTITGGEAPAQLNRQNYYKY